MLAGNPGGAERELRGSYEILERTGDTAVLSTVVAELAEAALAQGRDEEAERLAERSRKLAAHEDVESQVIWRMTRARLLARRGQHEEGEELAREAVGRAGLTESPNLQGAALLALAEVLRHAGQTEQAAEAARRAVAVYESKGNAAAAARASDALEALSSRR
jgi:tetratricopeptide (TPR) repeat protein